MFWAFFDTAIDNRDKNNIEDVMICCGGKDDGKGFPAELLYELAFKGR